MSIEDEIGLPRIQEIKNNIQGKILHKIDYSRRIFDSYDFIKSDLRGCYFTESIFIDCKFISTRLITTVFFKAIFLNCSFLSCSIRHADFGEVLFSNCLVQDCDFFLTDFNEAKFIPQEFDLKKLNGAVGLKGL
jgi:uncharacterized protein YjbI with pentapeptide repeats